MQLVRETLAQYTVLTFYDVCKPATIQADASQSGLGCGLMQQGRPLAFASRVLTSRVRIESIDLVGIDRERAQLQSN